MATLAISYFIAVYRQFKIWPHCSPAEKPLFFPSQPCQDRQLILGGRMRTDRLDRQLVTGLVIMALFQLMQKGPSPQIPLPHLISSRFSMASTRQLPSFGISFEAGDLARSCMHHCLPASPGLPTFPLYQHLSSSFRSLISPFLLSPSLWGEGSRKWWWVAEEREDGLCQ